MHVNKYYMPLLGLHLAGESPTARENLLLEDGAQAFLEPDVRPSRTVVFVSGFKSDPLRTWFPFQRIVNSSEDLDAFFLAYDHDGQIHALVSHFRTWMEALVLGEVYGKIEPLIGRTPATPAPQQRLAVMAHGLGAVIVRRALVEAWESRRADGDSVKKELRWERRVRSVLFAPAHLGVRVHTRAYEIASHFNLAPIVLLLSYFWPIADDLKVDSPFLEELRERTEKYGDSQRRELLNPFSARVLFGTRERLTVAGHYQCDSRLRPDPIGHGHESICKPTGSWNEPVDELRKALT